MDSNVYTYIQKRSNFGKQVTFESKKVYEQLNWPIPYWDKQNTFFRDSDHERRNPNFINLSNMPEQSENTVNTERVNMDTKKMYHFEGGWPSDMDVTEEKARQNYIKKKLEKDPQTTADIFTDSCRDMCRNVKDIIKMNKQIDMFEEYFEGEVPDHNIEKLSVKTSLLFKDPEKGHKRCINKISWHPDGPNKLAGAYCMMRFHKPMADLSCKSFVWDLTSPNAPIHSICPPSPITALAYNHKNVDDIAFGTYSGRVGFVDVRKDNNRISLDQISDVEESHHEPVMDVIWLSSKLNNEFVTSSSDGKIMWWDNRKLSKPIDKLYICESEGSKAEDGTPLNIIGGTSMEFVPDHGPKYLIGTEKGSIMLANKKPKKAAELNYNVSYGLNIGRHLGPIYSIKRNPTNLKYFMSVGDWSVNLWEEETKAPIMKTRYHQSYLTDGCWSPQRPGVFFVTRKDGWLDIWDYYYRQNEVAFSHKVSESPLTTIKVNNVTGTSQIGVSHHDNGKFVAVGDNEGTITLIELCKTLYEPQPHEQSTLSEIFLREKSREDHLKTQRMNADNKKKNQAKEKEMMEKQAEQTAKIDINKQMEDIQSEFEQNLKKAADDLYKIYMDDPDMTATLTERLAHGTDKKATKDVKNAQQLIVKSAKIPDDYEKKVGELAEGTPSYYPSSKETFLTSFIPVSTEKLIACGSRSGDNGREVTNIFEWKCSSKETGDKELFTFKEDVAADASFKDGKASPVQDFYYLFVDFKKRLVGIDRFGKVVLMDMDQSKGTVTNPKIIAECYCPEKCGAAISRDGKAVFYIDKADSTKIWRHDLDTHKRHIMAGATDVPNDEIANFVVVNDETIFICYRNGKACRYDMEKKSFERAIQFEGVPTYISSHLNYIAVVGNLKDINEEVSDSHEVLLLDNELREVGRYNLREFGNVVCMGMEASVSQTPVLFVATAKELFTLKMQAGGKLAKTKLNLTLTGLRGEGLSHFKLYQNHIFVSDKEGFLAIPIKGELDDPEKMKDLANKFEAKDDERREKEDKIIDQKVKDQEKELEKAKLEAEKKQKEKEEADRKHQEEIMKDLDYQNQSVSFMNPQLVYQKIHGFKFDRFVVQKGVIYTITEEGKVLTIKKYNLNDLHAEPVVLYQESSQRFTLEQLVYGSVSMFEVNEADETCYFLAGTRLYQCANGKVTDLCDTAYSIHKSGVYDIVKDAKEDKYHVLNTQTNEIITETYEYPPQSIFKSKVNTFIISRDKKLINMTDGNVIKTVDFNFDSEAKIVNVTEHEIFIVVASRNSMDYLETMLLVYDYSLNQLSKNLFIQKETDTFSIRDFKTCDSEDGSNKYLILTYSGASRPIILKKVGANKYIQPHLNSPTLPGISSFGEVSVYQNKVYFGTGRKIFSVQLTEKEQKYEADKKIETVKESSLVISEMYKDQLGLVKRGEIQTKDFGFDVLLSSVIVNPANKDQLYISKNSRDNKTNILRFNFQTETSVEVVKEVEKLQDDSYLVDIVANHENLINGIDNNGYYYTEEGGDKMNITELMTYSKNSSFNRTRSRQIPVNKSRTMCYLVADDGDSVIEVNMLNHKKFKGLHGDLFGTLEVKIMNDNLMFGIKRLTNKTGKQDYVLYSYDLKNETILLQANLALPAVYHVEAIRTVGTKYILVVANKRDEGSSKSGRSGEFIIAMYNTDLQRVFMSSDMPIGNKFGVSNVVEVMTTLQDLPVIMISKEATLYILAIESDSKLKQIDAINFSQSDGPQSTIESAIVVGNYLYVVRNRTQLHRVKFENI